MTPAPERDWPVYYRATATRAPRRTVTFALERIVAEGPQAKDGDLAVELGCGAGRDTVALLAAGFRVLAIDAEAAALDALRGRSDLPSGGRLQCLRARFEQAHWPRARLVVASFSLPLCPPGQFVSLWSRLLRSLAAGGRFAGHLYGEHDDWRRDPGVVCVSRAELDTLTAGLEVEWLHEERSEGPTPRGRHKHWHVYHLVLRKPGEAGG